MKNRFGMLAFTLPALVGLACLSKPASAQYVQLQYNGTDKGVKVDIKFLDAVTNTTVTTAGQFAGQLQFAFDNGPSFTQPSATFNTYCVDLEHHISAGDKYLALPTSTSVSLNNGAKVAYLYNTYRSGVADNDHAAALQVAIWETLKDSDGNLDTGNFILTSTGNVKTYAQQYLTNIGTSTALYGDASLGGLVPNHHQNVLLPSVAGVTTVPEPGTVSLLCSVPTVGLALLRRRRKRG